MLQNFPIMLIFMLPIFLQIMMKKIYQEKLLLDYHSMHLLNQMYVI